MAKATQYKFDATQSFYAVVGAGDAAVAAVRTYATDVQAKVAKADLEPKSLTEQAKTLVNARVETVTKDAKGVSAQLQAKLNEFQADAKGVPAQLQAKLNELQAELKTLLSELSDRKAFQARVEARITEVQTEIKELRTKLEAKVNELVDALNGQVSEGLETVNAYATRGEGVVASLRGEKAEATETADVVEDVVVVEEVVVAEPAPAKKAAPAKQTAAKKTAKKAVAEATTEV